MSALLRISKITKVYETSKRKTIGIENVNFHACKGEFISIIGPSGCGKSTLLRCIAGFEKINSGKIYINDEMVTKPGPDRFMVFQGLDQLFPWFTIKENIIFAMKTVKSISNPHHIEECADYYLELVGLSGCGAFYPYQLSGGMKQRASIARALSVGPKVLLMDEPFGSLDAFSRRTMHRILLDAWQKTGVTIIFVTHDIEEAVYLSDRILVFSHAMLRADAVNPLARPRNRDIAEYSRFLSKVNDLLEGEIQVYEELNSIVAPEVKLAY